MIMCTGLCLHACMWGLFGCVRSYREDTTMALSSWGEGGEGKEVTAPKQGKQEKKSNVNIREYYRGERK